MIKKTISLIMAIVLSASLALFPACEFIDSTLNNEQSSSQTSEDSSSESTSSSSENGCEEHTYGEWETVTEASCVAGEKQRVCENCNEIETEEIPALDDFTAHIFNPDTLCTTCGHQEFIESEEYIEEIKLTYLWNDDMDGILWWNKDRTYGLKILCHDYFSHAFFKGYVGTPVHVRLPSYFNGVPIAEIVQPDEFSSLGTFQNCTTLKSIYIPDTVKWIDDYAFDGCTSLENVRFSENLKDIEMSAFRNCTSLKILYFKKNNCALTHTFDYQNGPTFENCTSLTEIYFPLSYDMSGSTNEFSSCTALKKIYVSADRYDIYVQRFKGFPNDLEIIIYE